MTEMEMQPEIRTETPETCLSYERIAGVVCRHAERMRQRGDLGTITDRNLAMALAWTDRLPHLQPASARLYRAAVLYAIEQCPGPMDVDALQILTPECSEDETERSHRLGEEREANLTTLRGAQQRAEHLSKEDWHALQRALRASRSAWGTVAADWLVCSRATSLRPCEWPNALLDGAKLKVDNAKATNRRAHGKQRTIDLHLASIELLDLIRSFIRTVGKHQGQDFEHMYNRVRDLIADVSRRTLSKRRRYPTLYTARHMFASAAKTTFSKEGVAALMGHASMETAARHYAAARHARDGFPLEVTPDPHDVAAVRQLQSAKQAIAFIAEQDARA
ncbi:hypothetical protein [Piscinibacter sakaiensis]|uniref:hypothetical protein n=1 Tax=Piscinibacter sakaiensis TaxID=1547922 RepID=UPI003AAA5EEA